MMSKFTEKMYLIYIIKNLKKKNKFFIWINKKINYFFYISKKIINSNKLFIDCKLLDFISSEIK